MKQTTKVMLEDGQTMTEAGLVVAIKAAANVGNAGFARELLLTHGKNKHRPQEQLYVCVSLERCYVDAPSVCVCRALVCMSRG